MKMCPNCQNVVEDAALFCDRCGVRFAVAQPTPPQTYAYPTPPTPPQPAPRKSKAGLIIGIIAAAVVTLVAIVLVVAALIPEDAGDYDYYGDDTYYGDIFDDDTGYTVGTVENGEYVNEWADLRFDLDGWVQGSTAEYNDIMDDPDTECGLVVSDGTSTKQMILLFEDVSEMGSSFDEADYLDSFTEGIESDYAEDGMTVSVDNFYGTYIVAGETYKAATVTFSDVSLIQQFCIRREGDYMIIVMLTATSRDEASAMRDGLTAY